MRKCDAMADSESQPPTAASEGTTEPSTAASERPAPTARRRAVVLSPLLTVWREWLAPNSVLVVLAVALFVTGIYLFGKQLTEQQGGTAESIFEENRGGGGPPDPVRITPQIARSFSLSTTTFVQLRFILQEFDPTSGELKGRMGAMFDTEGYVKYYPNSEPSSSAHVLFYGPFEVSSVKVPLTPMDQVADEGVETVPITLETWGDARTFPSDGYAVAYFLSFDEAGLSYPSVYVIASVKLSNYDIYASVNGVYLNLLLQRNNLQKWWTYTLALSPLLLLGALIWSGVRSRADAGISAVQAAVGLVALLPLRQVLVPSEFGTITKIDLLLGFEFLLFISWTALAVAFVGRRRRGNVGSHFLDEQRTHTTDT
jgi:hypothetical protein